MLLQLHFCQGQIWEIMKHCPCVCANMCAFVPFFINHKISFIYEDIFTKFPENVYRCENMPVTIFLLILKNKMASIADCLKIIDML